MPKLETQPLAFFKPDPDQPRKRFDESALRALGESLKVRQNDPVQAKPDGTLIDGERRWRGARLAGLETLDVIITDAPLADAQVHIVRLTSFFHREDLTAHEKFNACQRLLTLNPGWLAKNLAEHLHLDPSMVTRLLAPGKCIEAVQTALREGRIGISDCYEFSQESPARQEELLRLKLAGASRTAIQDVRRRIRRADAAPVKLARVKIAMPSGATVVVSGRELSMAGVVELLAETLKEARKAAEQYDVKTFQSMMADRSKKA